MQLKTAEDLSTGDLVCIRADDKGGQRLFRWTIGEDAIGVTKRLLKAGEVIEFTPGQSSEDILVRGSHSPMSGQNIVMQVVCDLQMGELVCIRQTGSLATLDRWGFGDEAVGLAAHDIKANDYVNFCSGRSTNDIQVKPHN